MENWNLLRLIIILLLLFLTAGANWSKKVEKNGVEISITINGNMAIIRRITSFRNKPIITEILVPGDLLVSASSQLKDK